jgi:hypothetical protein
MDTCCFLELDGVQNNPSMIFNPEQRKTIWSNLWKLVANNQLYIVSQMVGDSGELRRRYKGDISWLNKFPYWPTEVGDNPDLDNRVRHIQGQFPSLVNRNIRHTHDPADPWLIAVAWANGFTIVTNELGKWERKTDKNKDHIPDVCRGMNPKINCINFEKFINDERLLDSE